MSRTPAPKPAAATEYRINLADLHPGQEEVAASGARFKVVVCGRQWGKTRLCAGLSVAAAAAGSDIWWVAPSFPIGELGWRQIDAFARQIPGTHFEQRPVYRISFPSGGTIQLRSADNPDSLRGATLNGVVFDEAAMAKSDAWPTLRPTLSARQGWAIFISTPKGLNWFHDIYEQAGARQGWERWRFPSKDNPALADEDIDMAREEMSSLLFSQEYEADFISTSMGLFHGDWIQHYYTRSEGEDRFYMLGNEPISAQSCWNFHTVDLAWSLAEGADYTVISTWAVTPRNHLLLIDCTRGHFEGPDITPRLRAAYERHGGFLCIERATRQMSIIQEAERTGLPIRELKADKDKVARALPATARMERGQVWFPPTTTPWWPDLEEELMAFPAGRHDDFVDTLAYAVMQVASGGPGIQVIG